jgi:hypothetical protein
MSLIEFCTYLKQEIYHLQTQLKAALEERDLYERLLREEQDEPMLDASPQHVPESTVSYFNWLRGFSSSAAKND